MIFLSTLDVVAAKMKGLFERQAFGVCAFFGEKLGISTAKIRLYFIYISFLTLGSPVVVYFFMVFWLNIKKYMRLRQHIFWM